MNNRGKIGFVGLADWWDNDLTIADRQAIVEGYAPLGSDGTPPDQGGVLFSLGSDDKPITQLRVILDLLNATAPYEVKSKLMHKGQELATSCPNPLDIHFFFGAIITIEYRRREEDVMALDKAIKACKDQIAISSKAKSKFKKSSIMPDFLPSHQGYKQLSIILEKQKKYKDVISLCEKASKQGWGGDWENRIARCTQKLLK